MSMSKVHLCRTNQTKNLPFAELILVNVKARCGFAQITESSPYILLATLHSEVPVDCRLIKSDMVLDKSYKLDIFNS